MPSTLERFWRHSTRLDEPCWLWTTSLLDRHGYGKFGIDGRTLQAHRVAYEMFIGPIPDGLVIDHLCRNRACVNPAHMEPVTVAENNRRGAIGARTQCFRGHSLEGDNVYVGPDGARRCRLCRREHDRARRREELRLQREELA
jgi:hypothetical protein